MFSTVPRVFSYRCVSVHGLKPQVRGIRTVVTVYRRSNLVPRAFSLVTDDPRQLSAISPWLVSNIQMVLGKFITTFRILSNVFEIEELRARDRDIEIEIQLYLSTLTTHNKSWFPGGA